VVDTNHDGLVDIVHIKSSGGAEIFLNNGKGRFSQGAYFQAAKPVWSGLKAIGADPNQQRLVDVNGDGYLDWISINATAGGASLFMHGQPQGVQLSYDGANNRRVATFYDTTGKRVTEYYTFDSANRLLDTYRLSQVVDPGTGLMTTRQDYTSKRYYDAAGRVAKVVTYSAPGVESNTTYNTYDANNRLLKRTQYEPGKTNPTYTVDYSAAGSYAPDGRVLSYKVITPNYTNTYTTSYRAFETYKADKEVGNSTYFLSGKTNFKYDVNGNLIKVTDATDATKYRSFVNNAQGEILQKTDNA
jgi:hypothetical protein